MLSFKLGLLLGLSLIISMGPQNLFVIKQGLKNEYPFISALACCFCDIILIILGVTGVSALLIEFPALEMGMLVLGVLFLFYYGGAALLRGLNKAIIAKNIEKIGEQGNAQSSGIKTILFALSFSVLNPQSILDTMVIIGGNANQYADQTKYLFVGGTIAASLLWFFGLAVLTSCFSKPLRNVKFWCALELLSGLLMVTIAGGFILKIFQSILA